jgi:hypothetical protein
LNGNQHVLLFLGQGHAVSALLHCCKHTVRITSSVFIQFAASSVFIQFAAHLPVICHFICLVSNGYIAGAGASGACSCAAATPVIGGMIFAGVWLCIPE